MVDVAGMAVNVFTYGSLMYPGVWDRVVRGRYRGAKARLSGYRRRAVLAATYPGLVSCEGAHTVGRVYFDVDAGDLRRLDAFEAAEYRRADVEVALVDDASRATVRAQVYVFVVESRLAEHDWDAARFESEHLADFAAQHGGGAAGAGRVDRAGSGG